MKFRLAITIAVIASFAAILPGTAHAAGSIGTACSTRSYSNNLLHIGLRETTEKCSNGHRITSYSGSQTTRATYGWHVISLKHSAWCNDLHTLCTRRTTAVFRKYFGNITAYRTLWVQMWDRP